MNTAADMALTTGAVSLPAIYETARQKLAECARVDECKDWADKAAALRSYARQADDTTLMNHAMRIQARAVRRAGELLERMEAGKNQHHAASMGAHTRTDAARDAGMSKHQQVQATRVARVPEQEFDQQVESESPPTVTALAAQGTRKETAQRVNRALHAYGTLQQFSKWCESNSPAEIAGGFLTHEADPAVQQSGVIRRWLLDFEEAIECLQHTT